MICRNSRVLEIFLRRLHNLYVELSPETIIDESLLSLLVVVIGTVRFSHRVAGPMVRYKRNLALLADGKLPPPLRTRRSDFLKEEVVVLNRASHCLLL